MLRFRRRAAWPPPGAAEAFLAILLSACAGGAHAAGTPGDAAPPDVAPDTVRVDTVFVTTGRATPEFRLARLPYLATARPVAESSARMLTVADVLEECAGVRVRRYGGLGAYATASIRGSAPNQVEIYLDGTPMNSAQWGGANLSDLPLQPVSHVEVYRGAAPAEFGSAPIGGIVNLVTRPAGARRFSVSAARGDYGTWKGSLLHSGSHGRLDHLVAWRHLRTHGRFSFRYDPGTPVLNEEDDRVLERGNNQFREHAGFLKLRGAAAAGWRVTLQDDWFLKEGGLPGHGNLLYTRAGFDTRRHLATLGARGPLTPGGAAGGRAGLAGHVSTSLAWQRDRVRNPGLEPGLNRTDLTHRSTGRGWKGGVTAALPSLRQTLDVSVDARRDRFVPEDANPAIGRGFERSRRSLHLAAQDQLSLAGDRLLLIGSWRYQEARDNYYGPAPFGRPPAARETPHEVFFRGGTFGARVSPRPWLTLKANRARNARFPTLYEAFGDGGEVKGNAALSPETALTWDGALLLQAPARWPVRGLFEAGVFRAKRDSLIVFVQNAQRNFKAMNLERSVAEGVECRWELGGGPLDHEGTLTVQEVRHDGSVPHWQGKWIPYVSARELFLRTRGRAGALELRHEFSYFSPYYQDRANLPEGRVPAKRLHHAGARVRLPGDRVSLDAEIQNITDRKLADVYGYPLPGRTFYFTVEWRTGHSS